MRKLPTSKFGLFAISLLVTAMLCLPVAHAAPKNDKDKSDLNSDQSVDMDDLAIFSANYLERHWETVDWCQFYEAVSAGDDFEGESTRYYAKNFQLLLAFINTGFNCSGDPYLLDLENDPNTLIRVAQNGDAAGDLYFTDPRVGSLFIYDANLVLKGEIKNMSKPLGVAVDSLGYILVGNDGTDVVEVYDPADGVLLTNFGEGLLRMPTAITVGPDNNIYVTDAPSHRIFVFDANYEHIRTIGSPGSADSELDYPMDTEVIANIAGNIEVYVADQGNKRVKIYDGNGKYLGMIDPAIIPPPEPPPRPDPWVDNNGNACFEQECTMFGCYGPPPPPECNPPAGSPIKFTRLQALSSDSLGRLHTLDIFEGTTSIVEVVDGEWAWKSNYGAFGEEAGTLYTPTDVLVTAPGWATVIPGDGDRIEVLATQ
jgi:DNA-binding beta-propeller fold protein YncE